MVDESRSRLAGDPQRRGRRRHRRRVAGGDRPGGAGRCGSTTLDAATRRVREDERLPGHRLVWTWWHPGDEGGASTSPVDLAPGDGGGTRVVVTESWPAQRAPVRAESRARAEASAAAGAWAGDERRSRRRRGPPVAVVGAVRDRSLGRPPPRARAAVRGCPCRRRLTPPTPAPPVHGSGGRSRAARRTVRSAGRRHLPTHPADGRRARPRHRHCAGGPHAGHPPGGGQAPGAAARRRSGHGRAGGPGDRFTAATAPLDDLAAGPRRPGSAGTPALERLRRRLE